LIQAHLIQAHLIQAHLIQAQLIQAQLIQAQLIQAQLSSTILKWTMSMVNPAIMHSLATAKIFVFRRAISVVFVVASAICPSNSMVYGWKR